MWDSAIIQPMPLVKAIKQLHFLIFGPEVTYSQNLNNLSIIINSNFSSSFKGKAKNLVNSLKHNYYQRNQPMNLWFVIMTIKSHTRFLKQLNFCSQQSSLSLEIFWSAISEIKCSTMDNSHKRRINLKHQKLTDNYSIIINLGNINLSFILSPQQPNLPKMPSR